MADNERQRVDKWLWAVRLFKTRSQATDSCRRGKVLAGGQPVKPAHMVSVGEVISVKAAAFTRTVLVKAIPPSRVGAKLAVDYLGDLTPPEEYARQRALHASRVAVRERGSGRPTKRERRLLDQLLPGDEGDPDEA
jgi:ribosome-associated heat shock protein Hsp15